MAAQDGDGARDPDTSEVGGGLQTRLLELARKMSWAKFPIALWASTRVLLFAMSGISMRLVPQLYQFAERRNLWFKDHPTLDGLCRWDCGWYDRIAAQGYTGYLDANFWPLYPLLSRWLSDLTGMPRQVALLVWPNLLTLGSFLLIYRLFADIEDERSARAGLLVFAFFPYSFFHGAAYADAFMVFFSALTLFFAYRRRYVVSNIVLAIGLLARHLCLAAGGSVAWLLWADRPRGAGWRPWLVAVASLTLPFLSLAAYSLFLYHRFGDPLAWIGARSAGWGFSGWSGVWAIFERPQLRFFLNIFFSLIPGIGAVVLWTRPRWRPLGSFALPLMLLLWSINIAALGRTSSTCWAGFLPLGVWLAARPGWLAPVIGLLGAFWGLIAFLFMHQEAFL